MIKTVKKSNYENVFANYNVTYVDSEQVQFVPLDPNNTDYAAILEWVAEGNTIEEAD